MARKHRLSAHELHAVQNETQSDVIRFRVTPSLKRQIENALDELGVQDLSTFARGALLNAIELARLDSDPRWREFMASVNAGPAKEILGHGLILPNGADIEDRGRVREGLSMQEMKQKLAGRPGRSRVEAGSHAGDGRTAEGQAKDGQADGQSHDGQARELAQDSYAKDGGKQTGHA